MPSSYAVMDENEMQYVDGGVDPLPMKRGYLNKSTCIATAAKYTAATGLSQIRIAKEIYAHAVMYYASTTALVGYGVKLAAMLGSGRGNYGCMFAMDKRTCKSGRYWWRFCFSSKSF